MRMPRSRAMRLFAFMRLCGQALTMYNALLTHRSWICAIYSFERMIFPLVVLGRSSLNSTILGYLYGAVRFLT